jgi:hypothetical protein
VLPAIESRSLDFSESADQVELRQRALILSGNRHFCEVFFTDVVVPAANPVGTEGQAFKPSMRQLEHERGGIDPLVSNHRLYRKALAWADTADPVLRQQIASIESCYRIGRLLVVREALRPGPSRVLRGDEVLLHRARAEGCRVRRRCFRPRSDTSQRTERRDRLLGELHDHGGFSTVLRNILAEWVLGLLKDTSAR